MYGWYGKLSHFRWPIEYKREEGGCIPYIQHYFTYSVGKAVEVDIFKMYCAFMYVLYLGYSLSMHALGAVVDPKWSFLDVLSCLCLSLSKVPERLPCMHKIRQSKYEVCMYICMYVWDRGGGGCSTAHSRFQIRELAQKKKRRKKTKRF